MATTAGTPTSVGTPTKKLDRYGFVVEKEELETPEQKADRLSKESERIDKWRDMIKDFPTYESKNHSTTRRRIRKGIPQQFRGIIWQWFAGVPAVAKQNKGVYEKLLKPSSPSEKQIELDISRTFPRQIMFMEQHGAGQQALFNVLKAYSVYDTTLGYCQGMGFIAALLLMFMPEEDAFWLLVQLLNKYGVAGLFTTGLPAASMMFYMLTPMMKKFVPKLAAAFERENVEPSMFASQWFITGFTYDFPISFVLRFWDIYLAEGVKIMFRFVIALLKREEEALHMAKFETIVRKLKNIPNEINSGNIEQIIDEALDLPLTEKYLQQLQDEYLAMPDVRPPPIMPVLKKPTCL